MSDSSRNWMLRELNVAHRDMVLHYGLVSQCAVEMKPDVATYAEVTKALNLIGQASGQLLKLMDCVKKGEK